MSLIETASPHKKYEDIKLCEFVEGCQPPQYSRNTQIDMPYSWCWHSDITYAHTDAHALFFKHSYVIEGFYWSTQMFANSAWAPPPCSFSNFSHPINALLFILFLPFFQLFQPAAVHSSPLCATLLFSPSTSIYPLVPSLQFKYFIFLMSNFLILFSACCSSSLLSCFHSKCQ